MKYTHILNIGLAIIMTGCVNYPENYTYNPSVTVYNANGSSRSGQTGHPIAFPNPFARNKSTATHHFSYYAAPAESSDAEDSFSEASHAPVEYSNSFSYEENQRRYAGIDYDTPVDEMLVLEAY